MPDSPEQATPDQGAATARWIDSDDEFRALVAEWATCDRLAVDTEFHRERTYWPKCALLQVGWDGGRVLVDPLAVDMRALAPALDGPTIVMHAAGQDLEVFQRSVGTVPTDLFDTQIAAGFVGMSSIGLAPLVNKLVGEALPKADRLTDWLARPLPDAAKAYAESDVVHLFTLHDQLSEQVNRRGRAAWVDNECALLIERSVRRTPPEEAWWRVKEARRLKGRAAAVAQEVAKWREQHAAEVDRPVRSVLPDLALASIAQRPPKNVEALSKMRGLRDRGISKAIRGDVLEAVDRGKELPLDEVSLPVSAPVPSEVRPAIPLLMSWVSQRARVLDLDPAILATRSDLESYLRGDDDARVASGWRGEALASDIDDLLDGRAGLSFRRGEGLVIERHQS